MRGNQPEYQEKIHTDMVRTCKLHIDNDISWESMFFSNIIRKQCYLRACYICMHTYVYILYTHIHICTCICMYINIYIKLSYILICHHWYLCLTLQLKRTICRLSWCVTTPNLSACHSPAWSTVRYTWHIPVNFLRLGLSVPSSVKPTQPTLMISPFYLGHCHCNYYFLNLPLKYTHTPLSAKDCLEEELSGTPVCASMKVCV